MSTVVRSYTAAATARPLPSEASTARAAGATKRLVALDALRGLLLIMMAINHIPSDLHVLSDQLLGYVGGAEGFIFLSGLLAGAVYGRRVRTVGLREAIRAALVRAVVIYCAHAACVVLVFILVFALTAATDSSSPALPQLFSQRPLASLLAASLLLYQPGLLDILPLYCGLFVLLPLLLIALRTGHILNALAVSGMVWLATNLFTPREAYISGLINTGSMNLSAWQLLFVLGTVLGSGAAPSLLRMPRSRWLIALVTLGLLLAAYRHGMTPPLPAGVWATLTDKVNLGPVRVANSVLVFYLIALAMRWRASWFEWRGLVFLGRHSLVVFATHVVVASFILGLPSVFHEGARGRAAGTCLLLGSMFLAAALARRYSTRSGA